MALRGLATGLSAHLPDWVLDEVADDEPVLPGVEDRMGLVNRLAARNHREGTGGPFAALVADATTGEVLSVGVNLVLAAGLSSLHAEVVAISLAQVRLGDWDLDGPSAPAAELVVNWRPCAMCYGAVLWSGLARLVIAGDGPEVEELTGFDEGPVRADWREQLEQRGIEVVSGVGRDDALAVFRAYGARTDVTVYNGRHAPPAGGA